MDPVRYHSDEPLSFLREWLEAHPAPIPVRAVDPLKSQSVISKPAGVHRRTHAQVIDGKLVLRDTKPANAQVEMFKRAG